MTDYKGAFSSDENWLDGWPYLSEAGLLLSADNNSSAIIDDKITLHGNYPNPFNPVTNLNYDLPEDSFVHITTYDAFGNEINKLIDSKKSRGQESVQWNATNYKGKSVSAGDYLYRIQAGDFVENKKMVLLK